ncbi:hypothetical protein H4582DRAFT_1320808 [Lactarius indigo]|nr:hypothetical protein H4582DRAFT_1320808 [Lactarius indigo]
MFWVLVGLLVRALCSYPVPIVASLHTCGTRRLVVGCGLSDVHQHCFLPATLTRPSVGYRARNAGARNLLVAMSLTTGAFPCLPQAWSRSPLCRSFAKAWTSLAFLRGFPQVQRPRCQPVLHDANPCYPCYPPQIVLLYILRCSLLPHAYRVCSISYLVISIPATLDCTHDWQCRASRPSTRRILCRYPNALFGVSPSSLGEELR